MSFEKSFQHSQALLDAALAEFAEKGYEQASINAILQAAGMSKGQFYYHFGNKEGLYLALIERLIAHKRDFLARVMDPAILQQDLFSIFKAQLRYGLAFARAYPAIDRFAASFVREQGNPIYARALAVYNLQDNPLIDGLIERAAVRGELRDDMPLPVIKRIVGYLFTHAAEVVDLSDGEQMEANLGYLVAFMRAGLARESEPAAHPSDAS